MRLLDLDMKIIAQSTPRPRTPRRGVFGLITVILLSMSASVASAQSPRDHALQVEDRPAELDELNSDHDGEVVPRQLSLDEQEMPQDHAPIERAAPAEPGAKPDSEAWRIQPNTAPPIQVRRAVALVREGAERTAAQLAAKERGDALASAAPPESAEKPSSERDKASKEALKAELSQQKEQESHPPQTRKSTSGRRILSRITPLSAFDDLVDIERVQQLADELLSGDGPQLVLVPYMRDPRWFEAMKLLKADECNKAHELASEVLGLQDDDPGLEEAEPAIRYAIGRIEMCTNQYATRGKQKLEALASGDYGAASKLARMRLGLSDKQEAAAGQSDGVHFRQRVRAALGTALNGQVEDALRDLKALRDQQTRGWNRYETQIAEVDILERAGRLKDAAHLMQRVYRTTRNWTIGDSVQARFERLDRKAGTKLFTFGERVDRMRELIAQGKYTQARKISVENAKLRGVSGNEIRGWSLYRQALEAEQRRQRQKAADLFAKADKLVKDPAVRPRLYFGWAKALRRLDRDPEAIALYDRICEEFERHTLCDQALFEGGRLSQYAEEHEEARARFARVIEEYPDSSRVPTALWGSAFSAYLMEDYAQMEAPLRRLIDEFPEQKDASELTLGLKAQYWLGVARLKSGDKRGAKNALQAAINRGPLTWYGRLAVARMKSAGMHPVVYIPRSEMSLADLKNLATMQIPDNPRLEVAAEFTRLGLYDDAISVLREQASVYPQPTRVHEFLAAVYLANDDPANAHWLMKNHIDQSQLNYRTLRDWGVAFPVNYMEHAHKYGSEYGVSPFLVQAIIRQESGFRPRVASYAGAIGLMQLMPGTARYTKQKLLDEGGSLNRNQILQPETNIRLGTMYIRAQTAYAADRIPLALAGYNAGPAPLEDWFERFGARELDAWVESITYREARGYVRKVFTSYVTYAGLYGGQEALPEIDLQMPAELRAWGEVPELEQVSEGEPISMR